MSAFALYIPCVYRNITEEMIAQTFYRKKIGSVRHVDLVPYNDKYNRAHVFFESMYPFGKGAEQMEQIANGETVKLQYSRNQHVFWIMMKNNREYDGVSRKGWYDPAQDEEKNEKQDVGEYVQALKKQNVKQDIKRSSAYDEWDETMEPTKKSRNGIMPIHTNLEVVNPEIVKDYDNGEFGLVSTDYVQSLELELARVRMQRDEALHRLSPIEEHLFDLHRDNLILRKKYDQLCNIKLPVDNHIVEQPNLIQFSDYEGPSSEYEKIICSEIDRIRGDNESINQNINMLSRMPNSSIIRPNNPVANECIKNDIFNQLHRPPSPITAPPVTIPSLTADTKDYNVCVPDCDSSI